ncbi:conserved protein of unknown function [Nitrosotalea devaniterrae]|uniref:Uncharacterized protein n=1 Tax=Nitrosotalea devaniterrae TaxID=1078905 RepID=A0A128A3E2_9ARCH|nr:conserved protein of unknown function [Candidatus Nitrosotalea devanaterra]
MLDNRLMTKDKKKEAKKPAKKVAPKKETSKKEVIKKEAPKAKPKEKTKLKEDIVQEDDGIIVVEDDTGLDKEAELEARKAYLEEARSQEASDD